MKQAIQQIYRIDKDDPRQDRFPLTIGYATGTIEDIVRFYEANGTRVNVYQITVPHITAHDADERVRLEELLACNKITAVPPTGPLPRPQR